MSTKNKCLKVANLAIKGFNESTEPNKKLWLYFTYSKESESGFEEYQVIVDTEHSRIINGTVIYNLLPDLLPDIDSIDSISKNERTRINEISAEMKRPIKPGIFYRFFNWIRSLFSSC